MYVIVLTDRSNGGLNVQFCDEIRLLKQRDAMAYRFFFFYFWKNRSNTLSIDQYFGDNVQ